MLDLLKKIGVPATVAAVIASLVTIVPFLFKVDERYAKDEDLEKTIKKFERQVEKQNREIAQLAGFQQAMIQLMSEGRVPRAAAVSEPPSGGSGAPAPVPVPMPRPTAAPPAPMMAPPAPVRLRPPAEVFEGHAPAAAASAPAPLPPIERPQNWREINEGLMRQQSRLIKP